MQAPGGDQLPAGGLGSPEELPADEDIYKSDAFRMQCMKVLPCSKRFVHDWTECPFAHPQEKARRRDPRVHSYTGIACPSMKKEGCCAFGDHCPYAHNVFEYWLHPTRYRTQLCNDGSNCKRKICFFAHSLDELRVPACKPFVSPEALASAAAAAAADAESKRKAATIGSPLSAFAALSPGPSPQRTSLDSLRAAQQAQEMQRISGASLSGASVAQPPSPSTADEATMGSSPADAAVHQALQQLAGANFSSQEQQVIELVTGLLAQDRVSPEQAASILQQMLPPDTLSQLQAHLNTPRASMEDQRCYSDPLGYRADRGQMAIRSSGSFDMAAAAPSPRQSAAALLAAQQHHVVAAQRAGLSLEQLAAMQAVQAVGISAMQTAPPGFTSAVGLPDASNNQRMSLESSRSSFDTARMSFEAMGRVSMDALSPRGSLDAAYPGNLAPTYSGQGYFSAQLSPVPEQFPMINAPPPSASWGPAGAGRFSLDSAAERLSEDMGRLSFEAGMNRSAPQPTANPYASAFFMPAGAMPSMPAGAGAERGAALPPLAPVRTSAPAAMHSKSPVPDEEEAGAAGTSTQPQMMGGGALRRLS